MNRTTKIFCSSLLFLLLMMGAKAQTIMGGNVTVSDLAVSRSEDKLFVSMDIDVSALSVKSNREVILTPRLSGEGNELNLPSVMIAGRNRYYHHLRNGLCTDDVMLYQKNKVSVVKYRTVVPYADWMKRAMLSTGNETCGCCGEALVDGNEPLLVLQLEP